MKVPVPPRLMIDLWRMGPRVLLPLLLLLLSRCGDRGSGTVEPDLFVDSVTFRKELDSAKVMMRHGEIADVERIVHRVLRESKDSPALRKQRMVARSLLGQVYQWRAELDSALLMHEEVLRMAEASLDTFWIGAAWINIGVARDLQGDYAGAMQAGYSAMRWKELLGDRLSMARVLHNLSALQWRRDSTEQALALLQRSLAIKRELDTPALASGLNGLGVLLIDLGRMDTAIAVLRESLLLEDSLNSGATRENMGSNLGLAFERAGMLDSAAHHYRQGLYDARQHGNQEVAIRCLYGLGDVRRAQGRYAEARTFLDSSLVLAQRIGSLEDEKEAHLSLVQLHERLDDPERALEHFRAYHALSDSLMNAGTQAAMEELSLRYDTEKKDRENAALRAAQELADLRAERNRWIAIGIGVVALALVALSWVLVQRNRHRARQREAELEQQALRLQMDPHFLFNALNTIPGLYANGDAIKANDHVGHLSRFLRLVLETSRRRTIPLEQEVQLVEHYLRISENRKPDSFTWDVRVMPYVQPERVAIPPMLIQPVVENAIEHGFNGRSKGHVSVLVDRAGSVLHIEVRDDGIGRGTALQRPSHRSGTSLGMDLVRQRIALFDKHTSITEAVQVRDGRAEDGSPRGTVVTLRLRVQLMSEHDAAGDRG